MSEAPDDAVPKFIGRNLLVFWRVAHTIADQLQLMVKVMPEDKRRMYHHLVGVSLKPNFADLMTLITLSEKENLLTREEAHLLREGRIGELDHNVPGSSDC